MGENKIDNDQIVGNTITDQQQGYGSQHQGRHNLEESSSFLMENENKEEGTSTKQQHIIDLQYGDIQGEDLLFETYKINDEIYQYSSVNRLNEKINMVSNIEGDDEDILGETENAHLNEQKTGAADPYQGNPQIR